MKKRYDLDNKGYSLVELVVVIALMAIGVAALSISIATIFSNNLRQAAADIESQIARGVVNSNYRNPLVYIMLYRDADGNLVVRYYEESKTGADFTDERIVAGSNTNVTLNGFSTASLPLSLAFNRGTGEILEIIDASLNTAPFPGAVRPEIILSGSGATRYTVTLTPHTGGREVTRS